jgi:subtilase family serine protease
MIFKAKSISNRSYTMLLAVSMASLVAMCTLSLPAYVNRAHAQTSSADKSGTIASTQNDLAGTWKLSGTWNFNNLNSNSPTFTSTFSMAKEDGSAMHKHTINDFKIMEIQRRSVLELPMMVPLPYL